MNGPTVGVFYHWARGPGGREFLYPLQGGSLLVVGNLLACRWFFSVGSSRHGRLRPLLVPDLLHTLLHAPIHALAWAGFFGTLWGVGGLTFGLSVRYMGVALGYAVALGCCAVFGTLIPPIFDGSIRGIAAHTSGPMRIAWRCHLRARYHRQQPGGDQQRSRPRA